MPPKKESPEEKYARATRTAAEAVTKADYIRCCMSMKGNPDVINSVKRHLKSMNAWTRHMPEKRTSQESSDSDSDDDHAVSSDPRARKAQKHDPALSIPLTTSLHRNFTTWSHVPPKYLQMIVHMMEPVSLNKKVMLMYCSAGQRVVPREVNLQFLEFCCDIDPYSALPEERIVEALVDKASAENEANGRRSRLMEHPVTWSTKGFYTLHETENGVIMKRLGNEEAKLPDELMERASSVSNLYVEMNFSLRRANIKHKKDKMFSVNCFEISCRVGHTQMSMKCAAKKENDNDVVPKQELHLQALPVEPPTNVSSPSRDVEETKHEDMWKDLFSESDMEGEEEAHGTTLGSNDGSEQPQIKNEVKKETHDIVEPMWKAPRMTAEKSFAPPVTRRM